MKQILFQDKESGLNHVGILMDDGDVICGCCGGLVPADEVNEMVTIIEIYDKWISLPREKNMVADALACCAHNFSVEYNADALNLLLKEKK